MLDNLHTLFRYRGLIQTLVVREMKARYRGSALGFFWSFANPLLLLLVYTFVFSVVLRGFRPVDVEPYALFLFCGLLPWTWFSSSLIESSNALIVNGNLIKKVLFPAEILPIVSVVSNMCHFFLALPILGAALLFYAPDLRFSELIWLPVVISIQLVLTLGLGLMLSALTVHFRDIKDLLANALTLWFFATPIIYPMAMVDERGPRIAGLPPLGKVLMDLNPFAHLAVSYQEILFYDGPYGHWKWLLALGLVSVTVFFAGYALFDRLRDSFAEEV